MEILLIINHRVIDDSISMSRDRPDDRFARTCHFFDAYSDREMGLLIQDGIRWFDNINIHMDPSGMHTTIGYIGRRDVTIAFRWVTINGFLLCYFYPISTMVDWDMIIAWMYKNVSGYRVTGEVLCAVLLRCSLFQRAQLKKLESNK